MPRRNGTATYKSMGELLRELGGISANRVCLDPLPGQATEKDLLRALDHSNKLYELVDGVMVEKVMGFKESTLAGDLAEFLGVFIRPRKLGKVTVPDGTVRLMPGLVRIPDVAFISWDRMPGRKIPAEPIPDLAPDLAIEVLSKGNTKGEMRRKLKEYFLAGVRLVWFVDSAQRSVKVYSAPDQSVTLHESDTLTGGDVLPGFKLPLRDLFADLPEEPVPRKIRRR